MNTKIGTIIALALTAAVSGCAHKQKQQGPRFGNVTRVEDSTSNTYRTTEAAGVHTPHVIVDDATPGTGATDLGKAEDAAHTTADTGVMVLCRRIDTAASSAGTSGDYATFDCDSLGQLRVAPSVPATMYHGQTTVTTAGTEVTLGASQALTQGCWIKALAANTGFIYVGLNPVSASTGYQLDNNEQAFFAIDDRADIFIDSSVNGESASYACF